MFKIVINGSFDLIHFGHLSLFEHARNYANSYVYVLTDSDRRIKMLKGSQRPVNNSLTRIKLLESLRTVDRVDVFDSDKELADKIKIYQPDLMIKGSDYRNRPIIGQEHCARIEFFDRIQGYSTTGIIDMLGCLSGPKEQSAKL